MIVGKATVGLMTGSLALLTDALHSFLDLSASIVTYFAVRISDKPADRDHHFGHGKVESLAAYESQLHQGVDDDGDEPMTKIASREFRAAVEGRARHFGMLIGAEFGEPFGSRQPVAVSDLWQLVPGGLR